MRFVVLALPIKNSGYAYAYSAIYFRLKTIVVQFIVCISAIIFVYVLLLIDPVPLLRGD